MYGREELKLYWGGATLDYGVYKKEEADKVMDAMEKQLRTLENNKEAMYEANLVLHARIKELEAVISKMETTTPKWISVEDKQPKEGEEVIVFYTSWKHEYQQVAIFESGEFIDLGGCALSPTHWMPLPPPPTTEEK